MDPSLGPFVSVVAIVGLITGMSLLLRGMGAYQRATRVADTSSSTISAMAAGEVRVTGQVEPAELTLISLLQSVPCVYYRSTVGDDDDDPTDGNGFMEERAVGFRVRDESGSLRVFPRGADLDVPVRWSDSTDSLGGAPVGLSIRTAGVFTMTEPDRETAVAELLRVREPGSVNRPELLPTGRGGRRYGEARLEPGDEVTIIGTALPFSDLRDPASADIAVGHDVVAADDPEIAADLAAARAAGTLLSPEAAWGNAAIPGFGVGRPVREPSIDPAANELPIATPEEAATADRTFTIAPDTLVLAVLADAPMRIHLGAPGEVTERHQGRFLVGLIGAMMAVVSAMSLAILWSGGFSS